MERTIDKANGTDPEHDVGSRSLVRNAIPLPQGIEIIWNNREGVFIGSAILRSVSPQAMNAIVEDLIPFVQEQTRRAMFAAAPSAANAPGSKQ